MFQVDLEASVSSILNRNVYEIQSISWHGVREGGVIEINRPSHQFSSEVFFIKREYV